MNMSHLTMEWRLSLTNLVMLATLIYYEFYSLILSLLLKTLESNFTTLESYSW
jgi:hypothetical protein